MVSKAHLKFIRGSARKIRLTIDLVRNRGVNEALNILASADKRYRVVVEKLLKSAISNAKNKGFNEEDLYISKITADEAARWKRYRAGSFGRAGEILKRTSHISIELNTRSH